MNRLPLSHSAIELFEACPLKFKALRLDKVPSEPSLPMVLGSFLHEVTDQYFKHLVKTGQRSDFVMIESLAKMAWANRTDNREWRLLPEGYFEEVMTLCYAIREDCVIDPRLVVASEQDAAFNEQWQPVKWMAKDVFFRAKIDRLELGENLVAKVWDLKTGRKIDRDANTPQMKRYGFVVTKVLPEAVAIEAELYYPRKRATYGVTFKPEEVAGVGDSIMRVSDQVEVMRAKDNWPAKPHFLACRDCPIFNRCPEKQALAGKPQQPKTRQEAERLVEKVVLAMRELEESKDLLKGFVDVNGPVQAAGMVADYTVSHRLSFDTESLYAILQGSGLNPLRFLKGDSKLIAREVRKSEALRGRIDPITKDKPSTSFKLKQAGDDDEDEQ